MNTLFFLRAAAIVAASLAGSAVLAEPVGVPTHHATALVDVQRGTDLVSARYTITTQGFNGPGHQIAVAGPPPVLWPNFRAADAYAASTAAQLKAAALASGPSPSSASTCPCLASSTNPQAIAGGLR